MELVKSKAKVQRGTMIDAYGRLITKSPDIRSFISDIKIHSDTHITIYEVFKWQWQWFSMTNIVFDQLKFAQKDPNNLQSIVLDNVINEEILVKINNSGTQWVISSWGTLWALDGMTSKMAEKLWKTIKEVKVFSERDLYGDIKYDIQVLLN